MVVLWKKICNGMVDIRVYSTGRFLHSDQVILREGNKKIGINAKKLDIGGINRL